MKYLQPFLIQEFDKENPLYINNSFKYFGFYITPVIFLEKIYDIKNFQDFKNWFDKNILYSTYKYNIKSIERIVNNFYEAYFSQIQINKKQFYNLLHLIILKIHNININIKLITKIMNNLEKQIIINIEQIQKLNEKTLSKQLYILDILNILLDENNKK